MSQPFLSIVIPAYNESERIGATLEGIDKFVELGLKHNPKMRFLIQESWTPWDYLDKRVASNAAWACVSCPGAG